MIIKRIRWISLAPWGLALALVARREFFIRQRSGAEYALIDGHALSEIVLVACALLYLVTIRRNFLAININSRSSYAALLAFLAFGAASALWSLDAAYSFFFAIEYASQAILILLALAASSDRNLREKHLLYGCSIATVITFAFKIRLNGFSGGLFDYSNNSAGACGAILVVYCVVELFNLPRLDVRRKPLTIAVIIGCAVVCLSTSAASIISTIIGIAIAPLLLGRRKGPLLTVLGVFLVLACLYPDHAMQILFPGKDMHRLQTLHGRTFMWASSLELLFRQPFLGYGYAMAAKIGPYANTNLHNSIMSILLGTGVIGLTFFTACSACLLRDVRRFSRVRAPGSVGIATALTTGVLNSMTISFVGEDWRGCSFVLIAMWAFLTVNLGKSQVQSRRHRGTYRKYRPFARRVPA